MTAKCYGGDVIPQEQAPRQAEEGQGENEAVRPGPDTAKGLHCGPGSGQEVASAACHEEARISATRPSTHSNVACNGRGRTRRFGPLPPTLRRTTRISPPVRLGQPLSCSRIPARPRPLVLRLFRPGPLVQRAAGAARISLVLSRFVDNAVKVIVALGRQSIADRPNFVRWIRDHLHSPGAVAACR